MYSAHIYHRRKLHYSVGTGKLEIANIMDEHARIAGVPIEPGGWGWLADLSRVDYHEIPTQEDIEALVIRDRPHVARTPGCWVALVTPPLETKYLGILCRLRLYCDLMADVHQEYGCRVEMFRTTPDALQWLETRKTAIPRDHIKAASA